MGMQLDTVEVSWYRTLNVHFLLSGPCPRQLYLSFPFIANLVKKAQNF